MNPRPEQSGAPTPATPKKSSLLRVLRIVISGFLMIGRNRDFESDAPTIGPAQLIIVAVIAAALLIGALVLLASSLVP